MARKKIYEDRFKLPKKPKKSVFGIKCDPKYYELIKEANHLIRDILDLQDGKFIWGNDACFLNHKQIAIITRKIGETKLIFVGKLPTQTDLYEFNNLADLQNTLIDAYLEYLLAELKNVLLNFRKS